MLNPKLRSCIYTLPHIHYYEQLLTQYFRQLKDPLHIQIIHHRMLM